MRYPVLSKFPGTSAAARRLRALCCLLFFLHADIGLAQPALTQSVPGVKASRLWLPPSREYLRPYLELAVTAAMEHPDCLEVMYARLNEYRTQNEEPAFTVLCRRDHRNTFDMVFRITEFDPDYRAPTHVAEADPEENTEGDGNDVLRELRERLIVEELMPEPQTPASRSQAAPAAAARRPADDLSLDLDLDEMLRTPANSQTETRPELF